MCQDLISNPCHVPRYCGSCLKIGVEWVGGYQYNALSSHGGGRTQVGGVVMRQLDVGGSREISFFFLLELIK